MLLRKPLDPSDSSTVITFQVFNRQFLFLFIDIVDSCMPGLVSISTDKHIWIGTLNGKGSGFIISGEGLVVTNCHVALNTDAINV